MSSDLASRENSSADSDDEPAESRESARWLGAASLGLVIATGMLECVAIGVANDRHWAVATIMAWVAIVLMAVAVLAGLVAVVLRRGRPWGIAAMVLGIAANPLVLVWVLGALGGT